MFKSDNDRPQYMCKFNPDLQSTDWHGNERPLRGHQTGRNEGKNIINKQ